MAPYENAPAITPDMALAMLRAYYVRRGWSEFHMGPVADAQVLAMAHALNDVLGIPIDEDAFEAAGVAL